MAAAPTADWRELTKSKRESVAAKIPKEWLLPESQRSQYTESSTLNVLDVPRTSGILTEQELDITENHDATDLVALMSAGKLKSVDVVTAYCKRAAIAQQCLSCLTEIMFDEAIAKARECDDYLAQHGKPIGPLHGLPISLKDSFNVKGVQATIGFTSFISHPPADHNSVIVDYLANAGAVFHVKTNLPQTMMTADSHNWVFGRSLNPHNLSTTSGGSTGGEAALIAFKGSPLGLATDIAGSSRIPALCCGNSSIKPTAQRLPFAGGALLGRLGNPSPILPVIGVSGYSVRDSELIFKTAIDQQPWLVDDSALNVPWRRVQLPSKPLRFGLLRGCPERPLHPPIARALHTAAEKLKAAGHQIVLIDGKVPSLYATAVLAEKFFMLDPKATPFQHIAASGEPMIPSIAGSSLPDNKDWRPDMNDFFDAMVERGNVLQAWHDVVVNERLDAIIMPGYQGVSPKHDTYGFPVYTVQQNLLNYPSGILPFGKADKELDKPFLENGVKYLPAYDADACEGLPAHIQITGKPMMDEELIEIMKVVDGILKQN